MISYDFTDYPPFTWYRNIRRFISRVRYGMKWGLFYYRNVYPYDYAGGLKAYTQFLKELHRNIKEGWHEIDHRELSLCIKLLERYTSDYYEEWAEKVIETRWGTLKHYTEPRGEYVRMIGVRSKVGTDQDFKDCRYHTLRTQILAEKLKQKALTRALKIMEMYMEGWWD